jgi:hypothetical protein
MKRDELLPTTASRLAEASFNPRNFGSYTDNQLKYIRLGYNAALKAIAAEGSSDCRCMPDGLPFDAAGNKRERYVRVIYEGTTCVVPPKDVPAATAVYPTDYTLQDVYLSPQEFERLPEFGGF